MPGLAFSGAGDLSRDDAVRTDKKAITTRWASDTAQILVWRAGKLLTHDNAPRVLRPGDLQPATIQHKVFLGDDQHAAPWFAVSMDTESIPEDAATMPPLFGTFTDLRAMAFIGLPERSSPLGTARALLSWHARNQFCANCATPSTIDHAGWRRICPQCETEHFPRIDPVVIMAIIRDDHILLGRQAGWPPGRYSCLAGFVEPGERPEAAVIREAREEAGVEINPASIGYIGSQAWPFPHALMLGFIAHTPTKAFTVDHNELEHAQWVPRGDMPAILANSHDQIAGPPPATIAHHLMATWARAPDMEPTIKPDLEFDA